MGGLDKFFQAPYTSDGAISKLFVLLGTISSVDIDNNVAVVTTNAGQLEDVRIPMAVYNGGISIQATPQPGDICTVLCDDNSNGYIVSYYALNPRKDADDLKLKLTSGSLRISVNDTTEVLISNDIVMSTINGNSIAINSNVNEPTISIDSGKTVNINVGSGSDSDPVKNLKVSSDGKSMVVAIGDKTKVTTSDTGVVISVDGDAEISTTGNINLTTSATGSVNLQGGDKSSTDAIITKPMLENAVSNLYKDAAVAQGMLLQTTITQAGIIADTLTQQNKA